MQLLKHKDTGDLYLPLGLSDFAHESLRPAMAISLERSGEIVTLHRHQRIAIRSDCVEPVETLVHEIAYR